LSSSSYYDGVRWKDLVALKHVDYGTFHLYPQGWGATSADKPGTHPGTWGTAWIDRHLHDGRNLGKPVVLEEFGVQIDAAKDVPTPPRATRSR
jgi:mannan endo-1,4-beta-mannosidase